MKKLHFTQALQLAARAASRHSTQTTPVRLVRDIYGRLRFALNLAAADVPQTLTHELIAAANTLGAFTTSNRPLTRDSFTDADAFFNSTDWHATRVPQGADEDGAVQPDVTVCLLDRQLTGQDWLRPTASDEDQQGRTSEKAVGPHRMVFFGLKGGVGRSTALTMVAWGLARQGKRVLLLDLDLESPGLSGLLLPSERVAEFGLVDWLVEDAVGQAQTVLGSMISTSPLADTTTGGITVAAAMGHAEQDYLAKLSRVYADVPGPGGPQGMGVRIRRMLEDLEQREQPDVVLIDSRAGLHDLAAVSITSLADTALLFATDSEQTWQGYRQLFTHWQRRPDVATRVRDRLALVRALTPKTDRERDIKRFQQAAYELFAETLYDDIPPDSASPDAHDTTLESYYHPSKADESAPHFPILVDWDERFQEFDPRLRPEQGGTTDAQIEATFGTLIQWVTKRISGDTA